MNGLPPQLETLLRERIHACIGRRIQNLEIKIRENGITILGQASTFYTKQMAQHCALDLAPNMTIQNAIVVEARRAA